MKLIPIFGALLASLALISCGPAPISCDNAENPAACQQALAQGSSINDAVLAGVAGYAVGSMMSSNSRPHTTIVQKNYYRPTYRSPSISSYRPSYSSRSFSTVRMGRFR